MKLSIHGSRTLKDERVEILIREAIQKYWATILVTHGEPEGVCGVGRRLAQQIAMPLELHFLNFRYLRGAFEHRSKAVLQNSDRAIFIWDGKSQGCWNEWKMAEKANMPFDFHELDITQHDVSVGFPADDWNLDLDMDINI